MQLNMPNCVFIIFGHAVIQKIYEHMQKQERTNAILITDYVVAIVNVANFVGNRFVFIIINYYYYYRLYYI